ncbi:MAG: DUF2141 domain-containing protein [Algoriphagus sp.]|jgi:uncharacterized protein (DUF2141 family)|nr:DUF2141 domain-containing protein [Algoriphagus sp.]
MINILLILILSLAELTPQTLLNNPKLEILISQAKSDKGMIRVLIFSKETGFPDQPTKALKSLSVSPKNKSAVITLNDLPPGKYAVTVIHDEDNNSKLTTNAVGYPTEKFGFSNNPKVYFSPPSFEKASFELGSEPRRIQIELR